jgi:endonuclease/exonuclease/phosphatase family metal-dependent hydrolase
LERSHSGLVRLLGKQLYQQWYRGFESLPLRHKKVLSDGLNLLRCFVLDKFWFMTIKICNYNIKDGFCDRIDDKNHKYKLNLDKQEAGQKIVEEIDPDILVICEADYSLEYGGFQDYKKIFNYPYGVFVAERYTHRDFGIGILSKHPIANVEKHTPENSRWIRTDIEIQGKVIQVVAVHPNPRNTLAEKADLFKKILSGKKDPFILAGDLNSLSPEDPIDEKELLKSFTKKFNDQDKAREVVEKMVKKETVKFILANGLQDTYTKLHKNWDYTYHTKLSGNSFARYDYIFCSKDFKVIDSGIVKNELTEKTSDHYPIYAVLKI